MFYMEGGGFMYIPSSITSSNEVLWKYEFGKISYRAFKYILPTKSFERGSKDEKLSRVLSTFKTFLKFLNNFGMASMNTKAFKNLL